MGIMLIICKPLFSSLYFNVFSSKNFPYFDIFSFPFLGVISFISIVLILSGVIGLFRQKKLSTQIEPERVFYKSKRKMYIGLIIIVIGLAIISLGFHYMISAKCNDPTLCGLDRILYFFTFFIPLSIVLIFYGFNVLHKNIK